MKIERLTRRYNALTLIVARDGFKCKIVSRKCIITLSH